MKKITVAIPVYADWPSLSDCIDSLIEHLDHQRHEVILVNDCGPQADEIEANIKAKLKGRANFGYYRNPKNLGFVKTCNRAALELERTNDIVLLNSDTKVTAGWLDELSAVLYSQPKIAAVSPRTNNATICTFPLSAINQRGIAAAKSYRLFQKNKAKLPRYSVAPTAHGYCMLIKRSVIKKYGLFDEAFGQGYGEEVDFCQRVAKDGWQSVIGHHSYVFHLEARSFSLETKAKRVAEASKIINRRYPGYSQSVREYIERELAAEAKIMGGATRLKLRQIAKKLLARS